jgi:hypothetical protein
MVSNMEASYHLLQNNNNIMNTHSKENHVNGTNGASNHNNNNNYTNGNGNNNNGNNANSNEATSNDTDGLIDNIKRKLIIDTCNGIQEKSKILQIHNKPFEGEFVDNIKVNCNKK